jgi:vancomycin resistance protein YoaR
VLGRFTTSYAHDAEHKSRAFNVELAAEAINGKTIASGATFSFNDAVGERTAAFGYAKAVVLRDGMIAEGMGGGACQVASTLHAAALLSGLDVVVRAPHSRPSAYIRMGLDATVSLGASGPPIDLKLKNPWPSSVTVHARAARGSLEVWVDGAGLEVPAVSLTSEILERIPFERVVQRDRRIADDTARWKAFGIPGFRVRRTREIRSSDGSVRRDVRVDLYPPTSEIVQVAPSFDTSRLSRRRPEEPAAADDATVASPVTITAEPGIARPALVQLRPSALVVLDNSAR